MNRWRTRANCDRRVEIEISRRFAGEGFPELDPHLTARQPRLRAWASRTPNLLPQPSPGETPVPRDRLL
jgi:hypothetical protein